MDIFTEAPNLLRRYREGLAFRQYVEERTALVLPAMFIYLVFSVATTAATLVFFGSRSALLLIFAMMMAPFIFGASLAVLLFMFFAWLELRAMAQLDRRPARANGRGVLSLPALRAVFTGFPPVPWLFGAIFIGVPLFIVLLVSPKSAVVLVAAALLTPVAFALLDRD
jgi:hypothetical protein